MTVAAGILFITNKEKPTALFLKRGNGGDMPGYWAFPGGHQEPEDKDLEATATREATEELGKFPKTSLVCLTRSISSPALAPQAEGAPSPTEEIIDFTTFLSKVDAEFPPQLNGEHVAWTWCPLESPPEPMHPGCRIALDRLGMHELDVAKAIADGRLTSPQTFENITLFDIRITGTGASFRRALDEYVWRDPEIYLNDDFLARCNGLPVIFEHPKDALLSSKEFSDRVIGTIMLPYIKGQDVWGIARVYDAAAIKIMMERQMSTSPAVTWRDLTVNTVLKTDDNSKLLVEGKPSLLDHVAICDLGIWDKGGPATGIRMDASRVQIESVVALYTWPTAKLDLALSKARNMRIDATLQRFCG